MEGSELFQAIEAEDDERVRVLLSEGADVSVGNGRESCLHMAIARGNANIVRMLLEHKADVTAVAGDYTILRYAVYTGDNEILQMLLDAGLCVAESEYDNCSNTPLAAAIMRGQASIIETLLKAGAMMPRTIKGVSPFVYATKHKFHDLAHVLESHGVV
jgi:ankyrin repeat protein